MLTVSIYNKTEYRNTFAHIFVLRTFNYLGIQNSLFKQINQFIDIYRDTSKKKQKKKKTHTSKHIN